MLDIKRLTTAQSDFWPQLRQLVHWEQGAEARVEAVVAEILASVRSRGDEALLEYTERFDRLEVDSAAALELPAAELDAALRDLPAAQREALEQAAERIRSYAEHQKLESWSFTEADGTVLGQQVTPLDRVGVYVPGGKAAYPSSVLMNVVPAKVAGVDEIVMVTPTPVGERNAMVLAAARIAGVDR